MTLEIHKVSGSLWLKYKNMYVLCTYHYIRVIAMHLAPSGLNSYINKSVTFVSAKFHWYFYVKTHIVYEQKIRLCPTHQSRWWMKRLWPQTSKPLPTHLTLLTCVISERLFRWAKKQVWKCLQYQDLCWKLEVTPVQKSPLFPQYSK